MGTNYARPDDLDAFSRGSRSADQSLGEAAARLRSAYEAFRSGCHWGGLEAGSLLNALSPQFIAFNEEDARWVRVIADAFRRADAPGGLPDAAIAAVVSRAGLSDIRGSVTFDDPVAYGFPPTSGYADDPVNTGTGNFVEFEDDMPFGYLLESLSFTRTYNSRSDRAGAFGPGWSSWATARLRATDAGAEYEGPDGRRALLPREGEGYARVAGVDGLVEILESGLALAWFGGERWEFGEDGLALRVARGPGTAVDLGHDRDGRLVELAHERGKRVELQWEGDRVVAVTSSDGRRVGYRYDAGGCLVEADRDGDTRRYDVDEGGRIVSVTDADGVVAVTNVYDAEGRVVEQLSPFGRHTHFTYLPGRVTVTSDEAEGPPNTYVHDDAGRVTQIVDGDERAMTFEYDRWGLPVRIVERGGAVTVQEWDERARLVRRILPAGGERTFAYDDADRVTAGAGPDGAVWRLTYDGDERSPSQVVDPQGVVTRMTVEDGLVREIVDPDGVVLRFEHDADGNDVARIDADGNVARQGHDGAGRVTATVTPLGHRTEVAYDDRGRIVERRDPGGSVWRLEHTAAGRLASVTDPSGARQELRYGEHGERTALVDPLGGVTAQRHDVFGNVVGVVLPDGAEWEYGYDAVMRLTTITNPLGGRWLREYDVDGNLVATVDPEGARYSATVDRQGRITGLGDGLTSSEFELDEMGRVVAHVRPDGTRTSARYDLCGRLVAVEDPLGGITRLQYSAAGRLLREIKPSGRVDTYEYDRCGRLAARIDGAGRRREYRYDADGAVVERVDPDGTIARVRYDADGRVIEVAEPGSAVACFEYDAAGRMSAIEDRDAGRRTLMHDAAGRVDTATDANGAVTRYGHDELGRLTEMTDPLGATTARRYDVVGRMVAETDPLGRTQTRSYDAAGRIVERVDGSGRATRWSYDVAGRVSSYGPPGADPITIERDALGFATTIVEPGSFVNELLWDPAGRLVERRRDELSMRWRYGEDGERAAVGYPDGTETTFTHDEGGLEIAQRHPATGAIEFERDAAGRLVGASAGGMRALWRYEQGDLTEYRFEAGGTVRTALLARDGAGRVVEAIVDGDARRFSYDAAGQLTRVESAADAASFAYDANGRLEREQSPDSTREYRYDAAGQLVARRDAGGATTTFDYDGAGRRVGEDAVGSGLRWRWDELGRLRAVETQAPGDGDRRATSVAVDALGELAEVDGSPLMWDTADPSGPLAWIGQQAVVGHGSPWALAGEGCAEWLAPDWQDTIGGPARDAWGASTGGSGAAPAQLSFRGEVACGAQLWLRNRLYDPATRSFLTPDPLPALPGSAAGANPYHYALNNPIGLSDPLGLHPVSDSQLQKYRDRMDRSLLDKAGAVAEGGLKWVGEHAGDISAVAGLLATLTAPLVPLSLALGAISIAAGGYQGVQDFRKGDGLGLGLDILALVPGVGAELRTAASYGRKLRAAESLAAIDRYTASAGRDVTRIVDGHKAWSVEAQALREHQAWAGVLGWTSNVFGAAGAAHSHL